MTEKERMIQGFPYEAWDVQLSADRERAKDIVFTYNNLRPKLKQERDAVLRELLHAKGKFHIESPFHCDYGYHIHLGENFYSNHNCVMLDCAPIHIGDNVLLGPNVAIYTAGHPIHHETRNEGLEFALPVTIKDNVWIGGNSVINPGVTIGNNVVIGSGSVVSRDIPDNVIAVGNPIRIIREITDEDRTYYYKHQTF